LPGVPERGIETANMAETNSNPLPARKVAEGRTNTGVHPSWLRLIRYCAELGHGEIEKLKIQDGLPVAAEVTTRKIKFSP
jgi:hypothetical protein